MRRKKTTKGLQTGRNLPKSPPHRYNAYTPGRRLSRAVNDVDESSAELQPAKRATWKRVVIWSLLLLILVVIGLAAAVGVWDVRNISSVEKQLFGTGNVVNLLNGGSLPTDSNGRFNLLIAGYSVDDPGHSGAQLTDSILLLSLKPSNHTGYMLSIPRDLYVDLGSSNCRSGYDYCKINEAYEDGGMPLLEQAVGNVLGVSIDHYALVDYSAVKDIVNAVGGIDITVNSPDGRLYDPNRDYTTHTALVDLTNGVHHLNGEQALDLSRARGDPSPYGIPIGFEQSDYQRTADQRQIFSAIKQKLNWKLILNPAKNSTILNALGSNIKTNLQAQEALPFLRLFNKIPSNQLASLSLNKIDNTTLLEGSYYDGSTQTPVAGVGDYSQIQAAISQLNQ